MRKYLKMLYENKNLLRYSFHNLDIDRIIEVIEKAYELISVLSCNLIKQIQLSVWDEFHGGSSIG